MSRFPGLAPLRALINWYSRFEIHDEKEPDTMIRETRVNDPIRLGGFRIYQTAWERAAVVDLEYRDSRTYTMDEIERFNWMISSWCCSAPATALNWSDTVRERRSSAARSEKALHSAD